MRRRELSDVEAAEAVAPRFYVCRLSLAPSASQRAELQTRIRQARRWYNLVLSTAMKRVGHIKANRLNRELLELRRRFPAKKQAFAGPLRAIQEDIPGMPGKGFTTWAAMEKELRQLRSTVAPRLGAQPANTLGERAFEAAAAWLFGGRRPRFRKSHEYPAINGNQHIRLSADKRRVVWGQLEVPIWRREGDEFAQQALQAKVVSIEVVSTDGYHFAAHLICEGAPPKRVAAAPGVVVGVDPGISFVSCVGEASSAKLALPPALSAGKQRHLRRLQRHAQRQADEAKRHRRRSKSLRRTRRAVARLQRQVATTGKQHTNVVAKRILEHGSTVHLERNTYAAFQRLYGRRMRTSRPGALALRLKQLAHVVEIDSRLALSQMCICGRRIKKPLSQRTHLCPCGVQADRDLFSAYLARHVVDGRLDLGAAKAGYPAAQSRLRREAESAAPRGESACSGHASVNVVDATSESLATQNARKSSAIRDDGRRPLDAQARSRPGARRTLATTADSQLLLGWPSGPPGQPL